MLEVMWPRWPRRCLECNGAGETWPEWRCDTCGGTGEMTEEQFNELRDYLLRRGYKFQEKAEA